ncbi:rRNA methylase [Chthonomonas calidirosea]|uniref:TrmH family RNA methyltransferase n=1 Tax=Chthonomonas calidirosea TaxID=454171 RepID=UPI0006DD3BCD|nr:RNA methyltransferase [Chthonomonas calidirosea]CEK14510.1 rRNA methylase [Chthonomonas calidirosea]
MELLGILKESPALKTLFEDCMAGRSGFTADHFDAQVRKWIGLSSSTALRWITYRGLGGEVDGVMALGMSDEACKAFLMYACGERAVRELLLRLPRDHWVELKYVAEWMRNGITELIDVQEENKEDETVYKVTGRRRGRRSVIEHMVDGSKDGVLAEVRSLLRETSCRTRRYFAIEGDLLCLRAVEDGLAIHWLLYTPELKSDPLGHQLYEQACLQEVPRACLSGGLMAKLTTTRPVPRVIAVVETGVRSLTHFQLGSRSVLLIAENIANPDNLGMILRTADAAGAEGVMVVGEGSDPFHKNCIRAARGAIGRLPLLYCDNLRTALHAFVAKGTQVIGATGSAQETLWQLDFRPPLLLLVGNEQNGLTKEVLEVCTHQVRIPMVAGQDSLNVGVAAGILLYEIQRRLYAGCSRRDMRVNSIVK